ncbi:MAG: hypothetical protein Q4C05_04605 [Akkermansia sp.]|nr:hypothetical protein [Akkermansia sp.]
MATEERFVKYTQNSEILSMGLQRMLENPIAFKKNDPDYYSFIINQIK